jgi:agmatine deiminase
LSHYLMPAEWAPQDRIWMAFPASGYTLGDTEEAHHEARSTWAAVAHAVAEFAPVTMVIDPRESAVAATYLSSDIDVVDARYGPNVRPCR